MHKPQGQTMDSDDFIDLFRTPGARWFERLDRSGTVMALLVVGAIVAWAVGTETTQALVIAVVALDPPKVLFALFCAYGVSGYLVYAWRKFKGRPTSVIATSTDEPDEIGLHR